MRSVYYQRPARQQARASCKPLWNVPSLFLPPDTATSRHTRCTCPSAAPTPLRRATSARPRQPRPRSAAPRSAARPCTRQIAARRAWQVDLRVWRPRAAAAVAAAKQRRRTAPGRAPRLAAHMGGAGGAPGARVPPPASRRARPAPARPLLGAAGVSAIAACRRLQAADGLPQQTRPSSAPGASSWLSALPERSSQRSPRSMAAPEALPILSSKGVDLAASSSRKARRAALADSSRWAPSQRPRRCARRSCACTGAGGRLDLAPFCGAHGNRLDSGD